LPVHVAFVEAGIPFRSALGREALERTVMAAALAWMRIGLGPDAIAATDLMKVVRRPARGLTRLTSQLIGRRRKLSLDDLYRMGTGLDGKQATKWDAFCDDVARVAEVASAGDSIAILDVINREIGLSSAAAALDSGRRRADRSAQSDDLVALRRVAVMHQELDGFESWLRAALDNTNDVGGVEVSTVHRVKGMEWDRVVVFGAERGLFPHDLAEDVEEERRVFHVAITRGRKEVVVLVDKARPSPFVKELSGEAPQPQDRPATKPAAGARGIAAAIGDRVRISGGYSGVVEEFEEDGVLVAIDTGASSMLVAWGETVTTPGGSGPLARPVEPSEFDEELVDRLKTWRLEVAVANSVPAYVVMNDKTLLAIAASRPTNERELIMIPGIGPSKLETYGDEILAICAE
jgi:DNA helicase-2/ATP-dependent DNA helicase PcrA